MEVKSYQYYKLELVSEQRILVVTLNRPPVNAFIKESYLELIDIINHVNNSTTICTMVLRSEANIFSAGADVKQLAKDDAIASAIRRPILRKVGYELYTCSVPLVVAVNGAVVGAGAGFAACGDIIVGSEDAYFSIPEINIGVVGGATDLQRMLPPQKVRALGLTGGKISVQEIFSYGGIESVVAKEDLYDEALKYAEIVADKGYLAVRKWKESLLLTENVGVMEGTFIDQCLSQELSAQSPSPEVKK